MRNLKYVLRQSYEASRALIIGINEYKHASPLGYAVSDAEEIQEILVKELGFDNKNVIFLIDKDATKTKILKAFHSFTSEDIQVDDRVLVFFAGHGHTKTGFRGEVGYLVPHDADMDDSSSFIRWDELTRNAELIRAKHILFIMDACYGGLAVNRDIQAGSSRFLKDMYQRFSRQVITAGKANEVVADSGGPLPNHSVFTGHLIEGIRGSAANEYGVITASGLMAYVYTKVANDINSDQTPHYGQFDGDGDFIISSPKSENVSEDDSKDIDELISVPYAEISRKTVNLEEKVDYVKELLSSQKSQIKLHDFIINEVRKFLSLTSEDNFASRGSFTDEELLERISSYEAYSKDLCAIIGIVSYWATDNEFSVLSKIVSRASDRLLESEGGLTIWINLRWYPLLLILYHAGIAAIESKNYKSLTNIFYTKLGESEYGSKDSLFVQKLSNGVLELARSNIFKKIPGHEQHYAPDSEYIFKQIQPMLDDLFFLGKSYESEFDEFEILYALVVADLRKQSDGYMWGPIGRFGWKHKSRDNSPYTKLILEAKAFKDQWPPIKAGMFGGDYERFEAVANEFKESLNNLNWF
ncbi:MAG: caspase family protein [Gammaproteobacteria bacterium]|nr:caspase family protein [Gammaproteobacteria bacterium]